MNASERLYIKQNLTELIAYTRCSESFLAHLSQKAVLGDEDIELIKRQSSETAQAAKLFDLIVTRTDGFNILKDAFTKTCQSGARDILIGYKVDSLLQLSNTKAEKTTGITFDLRAPAPLFTGRRKELQNLNNLICQKASEAPFSVVCIAGLGGIGKTELARKYAHNYVSSFDNVVWMKADSEPIIVESFRRLAKDHLGITTRDANSEDKEITTVVGEVYKHIKGTKSLFIFDNVENNKYVYKFLPVDYITGDAVVYPTIIFTSRESLWSYQASYSVQIIQLQGFLENEATEFVRKSLDINDPDDILEATALVRKLQCYPLALQQAVSYIKETNDTDEYSISNYLADYEDAFKKSELLSSNTDCFDYSSTTLTTWKITLSKIELDQACGLLAIKIINCMAYMSDTFNRNVFHPLSSSQSDFKDISRAVKLLVKYSMINGTDMKLTKLRIHKLVQEVIRIDLLHKRMDKKCLDFLLDMFTHNQNLAAYPDNLNHALEIWKHSKGNVELVQKFSRFPSKLAKALLNRVRNADAFEFAQESLGLLQQHASYQDEHLLELKFQLARSLQSLGKYTEAIQSFEQHLELLKSLHGESSEKFLDTMHYIATVKLQMGIYAEACLMFEEVFHRKIKAIGLHKIKTIDSLHNAAICYLEMSKYKKALEYYEKSLELYAQVVDKENDDAVKTTKQNFAVLKGDMGLYSQAIADLKLLKKMEQNKDSGSFWEKSADTVNLNLAYYLMLSGKYTEAYEICLHAEKNLIRVHGVDHPDTLTCQSNLAVIERKMGNIEKSLALQKKVYQKQKNILGVENDKTMVIKSEIALCWDHDLLDETTLVINKILRELEQRNGKENHNVLRLKLDYAGVLEKHEKYAESKQILEDAKRAIESKFGTEHESLPEISRRILAIGQVLENSQKSCLPKNEKQNSIYHI